MIVEKEMPLCSCGCGERVTLETNKYIKGHQFRNPIIKEQDDFADFAWYEIKDLEVWNKRKGMFYFVFCKDVVKTLMLILDELKKLNGRK